MDVTKLLSALLLSTLLFNPLAAEEPLSAGQCDDNYDTCIDKCDEIQNASEECYDTCSDTYDACLATAEEG